MVDEIDYKIVNDNFVAMLFSECIIEKIEQYGVNPIEAEKIVWDAWQELGRIYANPSSEKLQDNTASDCENVYYI